MSFWGSDPEIALGGKPRLGYGFSGGKLSRALTGGGRHRSKLLALWGVCGEWGGKCRRGPCHPLHRVAGNPSILLLLLTPPGYAAPGGPECRAL